MGKLCPQCNHTKTTFTNLSVLNNCTPPEPDDNFCVKCGTELEDEVFESYEITCPKCRSKRRKKRFQILSELNLFRHSPTHLEYVKFCGECGYEFR